jgi:hypothetical protein
MSQRDKTDFHARDRWLLFAFTIGPLAALSDLGVAYSLVPTACERGSNTMLHISGAAFLILALTGAVIGRHYHRQCGDPGGLLWMERTRWLAVVSICLSIASAIVIVAFEIPNVILRSCN